jgi:DNA invertase Pin-like site-specific DNA recombinase
MLDQIREGDVVVVWKLDRLARSTRDLLETMETIRETGTKFQSISEPWADTTSHAGKMIMTVFAGIAEFERDLIRERTGAGREAAKKRGVRFGRPRKLNSEQEQLVRRLLDEGKPVRELAKTFEVHIGRSTDCQQPLLKPVFCSVAPQTPNRRVAKPFLFPSCQKLPKRC